ncbi:MAG: hypothetical protein ACOX52_14035 [Verrucomicrobiota bacterium]
MPYSTGIDFDFDRTDRELLPGGRGIVLLGRIFCHRGHRVHREILPFAIGGTVRS